MEEPDSSGALPDQFADAIDMIAGGGRPANPLNPEVLS